MEQDLQGFKHNVAIDFLEKKGHKYTNVLPPSGGSPEEYVIDGKLYTRPRLRELCKRYVDWAEYLKAWRESLGSSGPETAGP